MAKVKYKTRDPKTGETSWYEQEVPDEASAQEVIDHVESSYGRQVLELEKVQTLGQKLKEHGSNILRGALNSGAAILEGAGAFNAAERGPLRSAPGNEITADVKKALPPGPGNEGLVRAVEEGIGGAAVFPPYAVRSAIAGGLAGAGGYGGGQVGGPVGEAIGSVVGGGAAVLGSGLRSNAPTLASQALEGADPVALTMAQQRMQQMAAQGMPINLSQGMLTPSNLDDVIAALANSRYGDQTIQTLRDQPTQLKFRAQLAQTRVPGTPSSPQDVANRGQEAATTAISDARKRANDAYMRELALAQYQATQAANSPGGKLVEEARRTGQMTPELEAEIAKMGGVGPIKVPGPMLEAFEQRLDQIIQDNPNNATAIGLAREVKARLRGEASPATPAKPLGSGLTSSKIRVSGEPVKPGPWLDDPAKLKGAVDDAIQNFGSNALNTKAGAADLNRYAQEIRNAWKETVRAGTPGMEQAAAAARRVYEQEVNPMRKSVTGRVAGVSGASDVREATDKLTTLFQRGTPKDAPYSEILTFEKDIRAKHPGLFADAVATNIADRIAKVMPTEEARTSPNFAAELKKALADNPAQERGLRDMLAGAARSKGVPEKPVVDGFMNLVRMATLAEKRPTVVSGLPIQDLAEEAGKSKLATAVQLQSYYQAGKRIRMAFAADAYKTMDKLLNDPNGLQMLEQLSKQSIMRPEAAAAVSAFFGAQGQNGQD